MNPLRGLPFAFDWKARIRPCENATCEIPHVMAACVLETTGKSRAAITCRAIDNHGALWIECGQCGCGGGFRINVPGADEMTHREFLLRPGVHELRGGPLRVAQPGVESGGRQVQEGQITW